MPWLTSLSTYKDVPIALRVRPHEEILELQSRYDTLIIISHALKHVTPTGLPEPEYNDSLAAFDKDLHASFKQSHGRAVIVETCSGHRNYYGYVSDPAAMKSNFKAVQKRYPHHKLKFRTRPDPNWDFYTKYHDVFQW